MELRAIYAGFGKDISKINGDETFELPIPATYVIGIDRKIRKAFLDADYTKRLDTEHIIDVLKKVKDILQKMRLMCLKRNCLEFQ